MTVYVHLATGFEELEALSPVDVLRRGGVDVKTVSVMDEQTVIGSHGIPVVADLMFEEANYDECDMIVLPGGMPGAANLGAHEGLCEKILQFHAEGKWNAAICAAPMVFAQLGLLEGLEVTIYPGMEDMLKGAKASASAFLTVNYEHKILTAKGPGYALNFALEILEIMKDKETAEAVKKGMLIR